MAGRLQRELKQGKPFSSPQLEAFLNIVRTADVLARLGDDLLKTFDLTTTSYNVLRILRGAGEEGIPTLEIAARMIERRLGRTNTADPSAGSVA